MKDSDAEAVKECDTRIALLEANILRMKNERNSHLPINRLPLELLCKVFLHIRDDLSIFCDHYTRIPPWVKFITCVCQHWRDAALRCPELWSHLQFDGYPPGWMELQLERSKQAPLSLSFSPRGERYEKPLLTALRQPHRLQSLNILSVTKFTLPKFMKELRGAYAPLLQTLVIRIPPYVAAGDEASYEIPHDLFAGGTPSLRRLLLHGGQLPFTSLIYSGLTSLDLATYVLSSTDTSEFLSALDNSPKLKELAVRFSSIDEVTITSSRSHPCILPALERMDLTATIPKCTAILDHLSLPISAIVHITLATNQTHVMQGPEAKRFISSVKQAWLSNPLAQDTGSDVQHYLRHLVFGDNMGITFTAEFWFEARDSVLHAPSKHTTPSLRISSPRIDISAEAFAELPINRLESLNILRASGPILDILMASPSLKSLSINSDSAATFFRKVQNDPILKASINSASLEHGEEIEKSPLTLLPELVALTFISVDFGRERYDMPPEDDEEPVDFESDLMGYLKLRQIHHCPIQRLRFNVCVNFHDESYETVKTIVKDVTWDGIEEMRDDEFYYEEEDDYDDDGDFCPGCGDDECLGECMFDYNY